MKLFVTVGTTQFDELTKLVCSREFQKQIGDMGYTDIILQHGKTDIGSGFTRSQQDPRCITFAYTEDIHHYFAMADTIVSHCGAGTVLDVLRGPIFEKCPRGRGRLVLVSNEKLMDNHQRELAEQLQRMNVADVSSLDGLVEVLRRKAKVPAKNSMEKPQLGLLNDAIRHYLLNNGD